MSGLGSRRSSPYAHLKVVELATDPAGEQTGKFLADLGAQVVKVEPPEGSPTRHHGPFVGDEEHVDRSLAFWIYNTGKQSIVAARDRLGAVVAAECADADVLITTLRPVELAEVGLDLDRLQEAHRRLVIVSVTPFGLTGPRADWETSDLVGLALGGPLLSCGYDDHSIPPIRPGGNQGYQTAASFAHAGLLLALLERNRTGAGQVVDVSMHEALAVSGELANPFWFYPKVLVKRQTCRHAQPFPTQPALFPTGDGKHVYFALILADQKPWEALVSWMDSEGMAADLVDPRYSELAYRQKNFAHIQELLEVFFLLKDADEIYHQGQAHGLPIGSLKAPEELLDDVHLAERGYFVPVDVDGKTVLFPGSPYRFSAFEGPALRRAPRLGEHGTDSEPGTHQDVVGPSPVPR